MMVIRFHSFFNIGTFVTCSDFVELHPASARHATNIKVVDSLTIELPSISFLIDVFLKFTIF